MANSSDTPKTILLKGDPIAKEGAAGDAITPGMLLELSGDADGNIVVSTHNSSSALKGSFMVAREMELTGGSIDDAYEADERVLYYVAKPGDEYYMLLAAGNDVVVGSELMSNADGTLALKTSTNPTRAVALQAYDNDPGVGSAAVRIKVEVVQ